MPASAIGLQILLILLPGFAAAAIVDSLAIRGKQTDLQRVVGACLYSFLIYALYTVFSNGVLPFHLEGNGTPSPYILWSKGKTLLLVSLTLGVGFVSSLYINFDAHKVLRKMRVRERTTRYSIWNDIFETVARKNQIVQVELDGDRSVIGVLTYYSDEADDCSLFISQAAWVDATGLTTEIPGQGILLTKNSGIRSVSLLQNS